MARESFNFDAVNLPDGGFYHSPGDAQGNMMVGFGRRGRNKWVQLSQAEIAAFLAAAHGMVRTDDPIVKGLLSDLSRRLDPPRLTVAQVKQLDPAMQAHFVALISEHPVTDALRLLTDMLTEAGVDITTLTAG